MSRVILGLGMFSLLLLPRVSLGNGGIPPDLKKKVPEVRVDKNVSITVVYSPAGRGAQQPQLVVPKKFLVADANAERVPQAAAPVNRTLLSGLALAAAFVTGGLWFVRRSGKGARALLVLFIMSGVLGVASFLPQVYGNIAPFPIPPETKVEINGRTAKLAVNVVVVAEGDQIQLVLPNSLAPAAVLAPPPKKGDTPPPGR